MRHTTEPIPAHFLIIQTHLFKRNFHKNGTEWDKKERKKRN